MDSSGVVTYIRIPTPQHNYEDLNKIIYVVSNITGFREGNQ